MTTAEQTMKTTDRAVVMMITVCLKCKKIEEKN